jgi:hypothetical protein
MDRRRSGPIGIVPIEQHPAADEQDGPDEPGVELRGDRCSAPEEQQHPDRRADAREPSRQAARGGDADVLARHEDPQQHIGHHRDPEQGPDLPCDHHEGEPEQGAHGQRAQPAASGTEVELVVYPREGHVPKERAHALDAIRRTQAWFDKHLHSVD